MGYSSLCRKEINHIIINLRSHLKIESIVLTAVIIFMLSATRDSHLFITVFGTCAFMGAFNALYGLTSVLKDDSINKVLAVLLFLLLFGFCWALLSLMFIPMLICEIIILLTGNIYIGKNSKYLNKQYKKNQNFNFNEKEKANYDGFVKAHRKTQIFQILSFLILACIFMFLNRSNVSGVYVSLIEIMVFFIFLVICYFINIAASAKSIGTIYSRFMEDCDSRAYYNVCRVLHEKYPNHFVLIQHYIISLRLDENDFSELKEVLAQHSIYQKQLFYLRAYIDVYGNGTNNENFTKLYNVAYPLCKKMFQKTKSIEWSNNIRVLEIEKSWIQSENEEALTICDSIEEIETNFNKVSDSYLRGMCLYKANKLDEAREAFEYAADAGNTLRMRNKAIGYIETIKSQIKISEQPLAD